MAMFRAGYSRSEGSGDRSIFLWLVDSYWSVNGLTICPLSNFCDMATLNVLHSIYTQKLTRSSETLRMNTMSI